MNNLICPVCKSKLFAEKSFKCENNHCFDISKYGVVNLMLSNKSSKKRHGDDKLMVLARKSFLDKGFYQPIQESVTALVKKHCQNAGVIVDAGCGEGYYTKAVADCTNALEIYGIDVSKEALRFFKKRVNNALPIVSSIFKMPIRDKSADIVLNMFAPISSNEFSRILKDNGFLIRTFVLKEHLFELKQAIYDNAYYNKPENKQVEGFKLIDRVNVDKSITASKDDLKNLFCMTPYYYKTGLADQQKLEKIEKLTTKIQVETAIYQKIDFNKEL